MPSRDVLTSQLFSNGANNAIEALSPRGRPSGNSSFPNRTGWANVDLRVGPSETVCEWFQRIIGSPEAPESRISDCAINDRFAFYRYMRWNSEGISSCSLQALVTTNGDLLDFYINDPKSEASAYYYRLDLALNAPGPLFKEPTPHLHFVPDGSPRFSFFCPQGEFLPTAFVEFVYLNHFHDDWLKWAEFESTSRDPNLPFERITTAFESAAILGSIAEFRPHLASLKNVLFAAKRSRIPNAPQINEAINDLNYLGMLSGSHHHSNWTNPLPLIAESTQRVTSLRPTGTSDPA